MNENLEYVEIYFNKYKNNRTIKKRKNIISNLISDIKKSLKCLELYKNIKKDDDSGRNAVANHRDTKSSH